MRCSRAAGALTFAALASGGMVLLGRLVTADEQPSIDRWVRRRTTMPGPRRIAKLLAPLFPIGLPGGYITIAYLLARSLRRRRRSGGPAIVTSAWAGWLVHRGVKLVFIRERPPRRGQRKRLDSYPSGHTTGATALALTAARVLLRNGMIGKRRALLIGVAAPTAMGIYRVLDDEHWTTDVLGGWLLGSSIAAVCDALLSDTGATPRSATRGPAVRRRPRRRHVRRELQTS